MSGPSFLCPGRTAEPEVQVARPAQVCPRALSSSDLPQREGHTFLATMASTQEALETRIRWTQDYLDQEGLSEDVKGRIRSAVGKANLLIAQKFQQFRELCLKNIVSDGRLASVAEHRDCLEGSFPCPSGYRCNLHRLHVKPTEDIGHSAVKH